MILAGDIGGTNTRLAFFEGTPDRLQPVHIEIYPSPQFSGLEEIVRKFLSAHAVPVDAACFGLPGAVVNGRVEATNLPWVVDARHMAAELGIASITLINDLFANAHGIALLEESDFVVLNPGVANSTGNRALVSAGTGLGEAGLYADGRGGYHPFPSEGGHTDFAPRNDLELDLLRREATRGGQTLQLTQQEFVLLEYLCRNAGRVVTRSMILDQVWGMRIQPDTNVVDVHIYRLRGKVDGAGQQPLIRTMRGVGYVFNDR